jgi:hypothetical protein
MTGYESKRAAAQAKLEDDDTQVCQDDTLTIAYQSGYYDGKKAAAQEPTKYSFRAHWEADGCIGVVVAIERLDGGVHLLKDIIDAPQPAQEPVAYLCSPDKNGLFGLPTADKACKDCFPVYKAPPQRPWVGLTDEETETLIHRFDGDPHTLLDEVNARLKEKNNG